MLDLEQMKHLAELSKLKMDETELATLTDEMRNIIQLMDTVADFDSDDAGFVNAPVAYGDLRKDEVAPSMPREAVLSNAKVRTETYFKVPKVV